jgi:hypothetical protein
MPSCQETVERKSGRAVPTTRRVVQRTPGLEEKRRVPAVPAAVTLEHGGGSFRGILGFRSLIFIAVIAAAIAVATWSLIKANRGEADIQAGQQYEKVLDLEGASVADIEASYNLDSMAPGMDFAFVLLAGADPREVEAATRAVGQASETLAQNGVQAAAITIEPSDTDYERVTDAFDVSEFPAVVLLGKGCGPSVVTGNITEDGLLKGYVRAACATGCGPSGCGVGAAEPGCCPGH